MTRWKQSVSATTAVFGFALALCAGVLLSPSASAQPADANAAIDSHYRDKGGTSSPLGQKIGEPYELGPNGAAQDYQGGKIIYSPDTGAKVMYGAILDKYLSLGGPTIDIGYPTNDESDAPVAGTARFSEFSAKDGATIEWSPQHGAWLVRGPIRTAWSHLRATDGVLGSPATDTMVADGVYSQSFRGQNGTPVEVRWSQDGGFVTNPPDIANQLRGLDVSVPGAAPGSVVAGNASEQNSTAQGNDSDSNSKWWALPVGLVIACAAGGLAGLIGGGSGGGRTAPRQTTPAATGSASARSAANHETLGGAHRATPSELGGRSGGA
ncbi:LGFP repeat-containing protein [Nocardia altamirensis]|uniref:LGFP repeat-containing protein n=1 Tax=Nocardia altamirensis TaxID=472158 RepID=UPI000A80CA68|nr:hypothetical protein [Nocardia altamirensis]